MDKKTEKIIFILVIALLSLVMTYWISQKQGFHCDEIFSYGSSNYRYDNVYQRYGNKDAVNTIIYNEIFNVSFREKLTTIKHYLQNPDEFMKQYEEIENSQSPIWKTKEEANEYMTIRKGDVTNLFSVYYNQSRDVHPPLFYIIVHIVSVICFGIFSKYIIFAINLVFFILTCYSIKRICKTINKEKYTIPILVLYGLSMGAISTMMFLRMYQMLIFFVLECLYIHLKIIKENLELDKKTSLRLIVITILGFLTHYYYCVFAIFEFAVMLYIMIKNKKIDSIKKYIKCHIISALIGIVLFPASIYHIFFSYRGFNAELENTYIQRIIGNIKELSTAYSASIPIFSVVSIIILTLYLYRIKKAKSDTESRRTLVAIIVPTILYFFTVSLIAPQSGRYISAIFPVLSIIFFISLDVILEKIKKEKLATICGVTITIVISTYGIIYCKPQYLYTEYKNAVDIAKENTKTKYICICDNNFTYLSNMPEFMIYDKSMIINYNEDNLEIIKNNKEIENETEIIVSIKKWLNYPEIIENIMKYTQFNKFEILDDSNELETIIYKIQA